MIDYNYDNYYFGGMQESPMGNPLLFPLTQRDIDKMVIEKTIKDEPVTITIDKNGTYIIKPSDYGVDGLSSVDLVINVAGGGSGSGSGSGSDGDSGSAQVLVVDQVLYPPIKNKQIYLNDYSY
jgi:hypothetical protein